MGSIDQPTKADLEDLIELFLKPYLKTQPKGLGFAIGYASRCFAGLHFVGNIQNQFGLELTLGDATPFEIASISKTFTSTLYALLIRASHSKKTVGDYSSAKLPISAELAHIKLDQLMNYTSGLPEDNYDEGAKLAAPRLCPQPYSMLSMINFLNASPPPVSGTGEKYTYSNLAFAIMSAIIAADGPNCSPTVAAFVSKIREHIFKPLGLRARFFDEVPLAKLPLGFHYEYWLSPAYTAIAPGHPFFPAIFGAAGIVATPKDMFKWLLFNMGITRIEPLTSLLAVLQTPLIQGVTGEGSDLGLGWFIRPAEADGPASIFKDGKLDGFSSYIAFLPSADPGTVPSQAGAFVLINGDSITFEQTKDGKEIAAVLTNDLLYFLQGKEPPANKSLYPTSAQKGSQRRFTDRLSQERR